MNIHKQKLLNDFKEYNLPEEIINKIKNEDSLNVYDCYKLIINYIYIVAQKGV